MAREYKAHLHAYLDASTTRCIVAHGTEMSIGDLITHWMLQYTGYACGVLIQLDDASAQEIYCANNSDFLATDMRLTLRRSR